jgi:hypothetical protein
MHRFLSILVLAILVIPSCRKDNDPEIQIFAGMSNSHDCIFKSYDSTHVNFVYNKDTSISIDCDNDKIMDIKIINSFNGTRAGLSTTTSRILSLRPEVKFSAAYFADSIAKYTISIPADTAIKRAHMP